jgi:Na+/melibiose symporter-like transporter
MGRVLLFHSVGLVAGSPIGGMYFFDNNDHFTRCLPFFLNQQVVSLLLSTKLVLVSQAYPREITRMISNTKTPFSALYQKSGYKAPFILCIVLAGVDLLLRVGLVERRNRPVEWFEKDMNAPTIVPSTIINNLNGEENGDEKKEEDKHHVTVLQLLRQHRLLAGMLLAFANGCVFNVFEPTLPIRLSNEWGYDSSEIGLVFLAQVIPTFIATPLAGFFTDKYGPKVVCFTNLVVCAISMFLIGIPNHSTAGGIVPLIVLFAIQGFTSFSFITPALSEMAYVVQEQNPDGGDSGQGMSYALFNIGKFNITVKYIICVLMAFHTEF